jgi:hypothetical protein
MWGYWQQLFGIVDTSPRGRRWNFEEKILALSLLKHGPTSHILLQTLFPLPSGRTLQSLLNTVHFRAGINTHVFYALRHSLQKMSEKDRYCCLLFDEMSIRENGLIRNLIALQDIRILEVRAERARLQIVLYFSWSVVCIQSGSSQWLNVSVMEVLRLSCLCNLLTDISGKQGLITQSLINDVQHTSYHGLRHRRSQGQPNTKGQRGPGQSREEMGHRYATTQEVFQKNPIMPVKYIREGIPWLENKDSSSFKPEYVKSFYTALWGTTRYNHSFHRHWLRPQSPGYRPSSKPSQQVISMSAWTI